STILGNNIFIKIFWKVFNFTKRKIFLNKLESINYFEYNSKTEKEKLLQFILNVFKYNSNLFKKEGIYTIIHPFIFEYDNRSYFIDFYDSFVIDKFGLLDKSGSIIIDENAKLDFFLNFAIKIGLEINFSEINYLDKDENEFKIDLEINKTKYSLKQNYENENYDDELIYELVNILNSELSKIQSKERIYFIDDFPTLIIFLNEKIFNYLSTLEPIRLRPKLPEEWKHQKFLMINSINQFKKMEH
nr:hypothetical protein [Flavobacterium sp.]